MADTQTLREKLEAKRRKLAEQIRQIDARQADRQRRDDTRRKIIVGALAITHAEQDGHDDFRQTLYGLVNRYTTRPGDRALFGLDPLPEAETAPEEQAERAKGAQSS
jgi:hypothetical protein